MDMAFLRIILFAALIFYAFSWLARLIFRRKMRKLQDQMEQFSQGEAKTPPNEDKNPHIDPNIGEYTDFEEVE